jgi:outer membrane protein OmpA-like peptidoglycan-associated protein
MKIYGDEQKEMFFGASVGIDYAADKNIDIMINLDVRASENIVAYGASFGVKYKFSSISIIEKPKEKAAVKEKVTVKKTVNVKSAKKKKRIIRIVRRPSEAKASSRSNEAISDTIIRSEIKARNVDELKTIEGDIQKAIDIRNSAKTAFRLGSTLFGAGSAQLAESAKADLRQAAAEIKEMDYKTVMIEGHSDNSGSNEKNKYLSLERAKAIYIELLKNGIPAKKMKFVGFGSNVPIDTNTTPEGRAKNRRVEIFIL